MRPIVGPSKEEFIKLYHFVDGNFRLFNQHLKDDFNMPEMAGRTFRRKVLNWVRNGKPKIPKDDQEDTRPVAGGVIEAPDKRRRVLNGKRFVFTSAQNNTFVHEAFWENLLTFCEHKDAQLVVSKFRYNKSGFQNYTQATDGDLWYDPKVLPYIIDESVVLQDACTGLVWCGELDILPTAVNPLSGLDSYTHMSSSIIPHAKVQLKSVPVLKGDATKMMYTTGACTQRNYIQRKAGQKAEFHHVFSALFVEIDDDGDYFARHLIADANGNFYDLKEYFANGCVVSGEVEAINWGDIHSEMVDGVVADAAWGTDESMLDVLKPKYQFVHDLTDFRARNHHNLKNPHFLAQVHFDRVGNVEYGMYQAFGTLKDLEREWCKTVVVESNHDLAFKKWLAEADIRQDPENAWFFHTANAELFYNIAKDGAKRFNIFEWAVRRCGTLDNTLFLREDDSFVICGANGIECSLHGHNGPNGARGTPNSLRNLGRKFNVGHAHSAAIVDGVYVAGISCKMDMGYNKGPGSWSHSHIVTYPNGKRQIITMKNGKWRAQ